GLFCACRVPLFCWLAENKLEISINILPNHAAPHMSYEGGALGWGREGVDVERVSCSSLSLCVCVCVCVCVCECVYKVCLYVCVCVCSLLHIHRLASGPACYFCGNEASLFWSFPFP